MRIAARDGAEAHALGEERKLIARVVGGEERAFDALLDRHSPRLKAVARRILRDASDVDEAVHEAMVQAYRALPRFDGRARLSTWLHRIVVNTALRLREKRGRTEASLDQLGSDGSDLEFAIDDQEPFMRMIGAEQRTLLLRRIEQLPPSYREVVVLRDLQELSTQKAATLLGISCVNVRARLHRAHRELKAQLRSTDDDHDSFLSAVG